MDENKHMKLKTKLLIGAIIALGFGGRYLFEYANAWVGVLAYGLAGALMIHTLMLVINHSNTKNKE